MLLLLLSHQDFQLSMGPSQDLTNQTLRSSGQDEQVSMVGYMFPRDASDYMQATQHFINLKQQQRWALGDDTVTAELVNFSFLFIYLFFVVATVMYNALGLYTQ